MPDSVAVAGAKSALKAAESKASVIYASAAKVIAEHGDLPEGRPAIRAAQKRAAAASDAVAEASRALSRARIAEQDVAAARQAPLRKAIWERIRQSFTDILCEAEKLHHLDTEMIEHGLTPPQPKLPEAIRDRVLVARALIPDLPP